VERLRVRQLTLRLRIVPQQNLPLTEQHWLQNSAILEAKHKLNLVVCDAKTRKTMLGQWPL
jgi:hypothetical protein